MKIKELEIENPIAFAVVIPGIAWCSLVVVAATLSVIVLALPAMPFIMVSYALQKLLGKN
jgi:hypothetical protein